ncbi:MAG TPA: PD-(D/E)XK nuclease family protein, partial [Gemmatimonas sp.]|nr:PD-(D/E)XK nuclease family protein [Gemmatimonas sp.]
DDGVAPHRIAVIARQARPLVDTLSDALTTVGVPVTARRRVALAHTGPARALRALLSVPIEGWSRHAVVELADNPLLALGLDAAVLDFVGMESPLASCDQWTAALERLRDRAVAREGANNDERDHERRRALPASARIIATLDAWHALAAGVRWLDGEHNPAEWLAWTHGVLTGQAWGIASRLTDAPAGDGYVQRTECKARDRIETLVQEWMRALETFGVPADAPVNAERFLVQLGTALNEDLILQPETGFGVVVAEALAAGWRSFEHVFVVGLTSGEFPRRMPVSALLSDSDRDAMIAAGLPLDPRSAWKSRERELFRVLCAAPTESLVLSWPTIDADGREVVRSSFVESRIEAAALAAGPLVDEKPDATLQRVGAMVCVAPHETITRGFPIVSRAHTALSIEHARRVAAIERERSRTLSPWNGAIEEPVLLAELERRYGPTYQWSATSIEELAKCPYSWMAKRLLRLEERSEADDAIEPTVTGRILHSALERFFDTEGKRRGGEPVYLTPPDRATVTATAAASLDAAWNDEESASWLGVPAMRTFVKRGLLQQLNQYLHFEMSYNDKRDDNRTNSSKSVHSGAILGELRFDSITITCDNSSFLLRGSIDRVDRSCDTRITDGRTYLAVIDYKSSKYSTPAAGHAKGWDDGVVLQVPLYAQVVSQLQREGRVPAGELARLEYRTLRSPAITHPLQFKIVKGEGKPGKKTFTVLDDERAQEKFASALQAAGDRVEQARRGEFPAGPAPSCGCSPYCPARDVCRIPGGPASANHGGDTE